MSDFYTPHYFEPVVAAGVRYSYTGALTEPRQVLRGGYLSWQDAASGHWWQETLFDGDQPEFTDLGAIDQKKAGNARAAIDRITMQYTLKAVALGRQKAEAAGLTAAVVEHGSAANAYAWREQIDEILGAARKTAFSAPSTRRRPARRTTKG